MPQDYCHNCGQPIVFRYVSGVCTPMHASGGCSGARSESGSQRLNSQSWKHAECCTPSICPKCRQNVFFVRHNGGAVWFDNLGWPWPKHPCFDRDPLQVTMDWVFERLAMHSDDQAFGVVVKVVRFADATFSAKMLAIGISDQTGVCVRVGSRSQLDCGDLVTLENAESKKLVLRDSECREHAAVLVPPSTLELTPEFIRHGVVRRPKPHKPARRSERPGFVRLPSGWAKCTACGAKLLHKNLPRHMRRVHGRSGYAVSSTND